MSELDDFLSTTLPRQLEAERAIHTGDPEPRMAMWSTNDPVTVLGAGQNATGWDEASKLFRWLAAGCSTCTAYRFDLIAASVSGDPACTTGYEHTSVSWDGVPRERYTLRVTHLYRRENSEWTIVHRHGDKVSTDKSASADPSVM